jgi:ribokinase
MKILTFGAINIDYVYHVDRFVREGESITCNFLELILGGKGCNQSIAIAHSGLPVYHSTKVGIKDTWLIDELKRYNVDVSFVKPVDAPSGHAIIQMDESGNNSIILYGGANHMITEEDIEEVFSHFGPGDILLTQNELNLTCRIIEEDHERGMKIFMNATPVERTILHCPFPYVDYVIVNETEAEALTNEDHPDNILSSMRAKFPKGVIIITLGGKGAVCLDTNGKRYQIPAVNVVPVATTSAGDTFTGYFVASIAKNSSVEDSIKLACKAAALCVTRKGTTNSIPRIDEVNSWTL